MAQFPEVRVELPGGFDDDAFGGRALRSRTRLALEGGGLGEQSLDYLTATRHLQDEDQREDLLRVTTDWVTLVRPDAAAPPSLRSETQPAAPDRHSLTASGSWSTPAGRVRRLGRVVEMAGWVLLPFTVIGGLTVALRREPSCAVAGADCSFDERYPDFAIGTFLGFSGAVIATAIVLGAAYIRARADGEIPSATPTRRMTSG